MKERWCAITDISLLGVCFILKSMVNVEKHTTVGFMLKDQLLISLKLTTIGS